MPPGHDVRIVDPETCAEVGPDRTGEIWYRGGNVAAGYWNRPELTAEVFGGVLAGETDPSRTYLRTGDLGFLLDGRLHVTGRIKDLMIVRGRNVHPQDVEAAAQRVDRRLREGRGVAFAVALGDGEGIGLVQETAESRPEELRRLAALARQSVIDSVQAPVVALHLVKPRSILRTSSGKLRRAATRQALDEGRLAVLHRELEAAVVDGGER
jgi:acyl-CoA synthetase (AMP-forming)/AMP-acid ligase II